VNDNDEEVDKDPSEDDDDTDNVEVDAEEAARSRVSNAAVRFSAAPSCCKRPCRVSCTFSLRIEDNE
jgi:hypothetical protein